MSGQNYYNLLNHFILLLYGLLNRVMADKAWMLKRNPRLVFYTNGLARDQGQVEPLAASGGAVTHADRALG